MHAPLITDRRGMGMFSHQLEYPMHEIKDAAGTIVKHEQGIVYGETIHIKNREDTKSTKPRVKFSFTSYDEHQMHDMYSHGEYVRGERRPRLSDNEKDIIRAELIHYKLYEMIIHEESRNNFNLHNKTNVMRHVANKLYEQSLERQNAMQKAHMFGTAVPRPMSTAVKPASPRKQNTTSRWLFDVFLQTSKFKPSTSSV